MLEGRALKAMASIMCGKLGVHKCGNVGVLLFPPKLNRRNRS